MHKTTDGGASWSLELFMYEKDLQAIQVLSPSHVVVAGGPVGALALGETFTSHTTDGGATWKNIPLKGAGTGAVMGLSLAADGQSGFATTCSTALQKCNIFGFTP